MKVYVLGPVIVCLATLALPVDNRGVPLYLILYFSGVVLGQWMDHGE